MLNEGHPNNPVTRDKYAAVLFDLDGVITNTAKMHAACWKTMFDEYLQKRSAKTREPFRPFDIVSDYTLHVDGKPRFDGVRDFYSLEVSGFLKERRMIHLGKKRCAGLEITKTN